MTKEQLSNLHTGDEVFWNDPDDGVCSRHYTIASIQIINPEDSDPVARIVDQDGAVLECFASELS